MSSISSHRNTLPIDRLNTPIIKPMKQSSEGRNPLELANQNSESQNIKTSTKQPGPVWTADSKAQLQTILANTKQAAKAELTPEAEARVAAEGLVSATFIEPILKQIRESNTAPPPFGPSSAEKQFSSLLDTNIADEIVHAANFPLVERIANQLLKNMPQIQPEKSIDIEG